MKVTDRVDSVKGVGEKTRALFEKLDIMTIGQLLTYYPRDYESFDGPFPVETLRENSIGVIEASVSHISETRHTARTILT